MTFTPGWALRIALADAVLATAGIYAETRETSTDERPALLM